MVSVRGVLDKGTKGILFMVGRGFLCGECDKSFAHQFDSILAKYFRKSKQLIYSDHCESPWKSLGTGDTDEIRNVKLHLFGAFVSAENQAEYFDLTWGFNMDLIPCCPS